MKTRKIVISLILSVFMFLAVGSLDAFAYGNLDEIHEYYITADVEDDATVTLTYHIKWEVLDSTTDGPLTWIKVGIPNSHCDQIEGLSDTVKSISKLSSGGNYVRIDLDRSYNKGDILDIDFKVVQDYLYQVNKFEEGSTVYNFTPGWFDDTYVDEMIIKWNSDKATEWTPDCLMDDGYLIWTTPLNEGEKYSISVTYPNDAFGFDLSKNSEEADRESVGDIILTIIVGIVIVMSMTIPIIAFMVIVYCIKRYLQRANFSSSTTKKVTKTKIKYYPVCQGCGATREEGLKNCKYCGRSFIESEEIIDEEQVPEEEKNAYSKMKNDGLYKFSDNTYVRVHSVAVPVRPSVNRGSNSCFHSSCACAHSCACACACACAGGGRAGCTNKDFYNTDLKLHMLEIKKKKKNEQKGITNS